MSNDPLPRMCCLSLLTQSQWRYRANVSQQFTIESIPRLNQALTTSSSSSHDDITYQSIAKAFGLPLVLHQEAFELMKKLSKPHPNQPNFRWDEDSPALRAKLRMVELPTDPSRPIAEQAVFPCKDAWVPVSIVNGNVYILPGVPKLCKFRGGGSRVYTWVVIMGWC